MIETDKDEVMAQDFTKLESIASHFVYDGFAFHLLDRVGDVALFKKSKHGRNFYEVVVVQQLPARTIFGRAYPPREALPPSESWGTQGWSLATVERAREKFAEVVRARQEASFSPGRTAVEAFSESDGLPSAITSLQPLQSGTSIEIGDFDPRPVHPTAFITKPRE